VSVVAASAGGISIKTPAQSLFAQDANEFATRFTEYAESEMLRCVPFNNPPNGSYGSFDQAVRLTDEKKSPGSSVLNSRADADDL
jgi:hypothetical protein